MKLYSVNIKTIVLISVFFNTNCQNPNAKAPETALESEPAMEIVVGAARTDLYFPIIKDKKLGLIVNQTSTVDSNHLVDVLLEADMEIVKIFAPEHGFRGEADAGEEVTDGKDKETGIPIGSLYGDKKKLSAEDLAGIDLLIFDIQDVGARFYTYISTMHYIMESAAENKVPFLVLDRPNPNGHYVDGPVLDTAGFRSFVGMHPIPVVHGMTIGEYAQMVNGEGWLKNGIKCDLQIIPCENYDHQTAYELPIKPSPNLPNNRSIYLYPSICYFEGTVFSLGRGTTTQFQVIGAPDFPETEFSFTPIPRPGAKYPKHQDQVCYGLDLSQLDPAAIRAEKRLNLTYLLEVYQKYPDKDNFFLKSNFFSKLAGGDHLKAQLQAGKSEAEIRASWEPALSEYKDMRKAYLLYKE